MWYDAASACDLLQRAGVLLMIGDSLVRHMTQAMFTVLSGDYENTTAVGTKPTDEGYMSCRCDAAYDEGHRSYGLPMEEVNKPKNKYCRGHSISGLSWRSINQTRLLVPGFCPAWREQHLCFGRCQGPLPPRGFAYVSGGLHYEELNDETVGLVFGNHGHGVRNGGTSLTPGAPIHYSKICGLMHCPGKDKPIKYLRSHGLEATVAYNAAIERAACRRPGDFLFNPFSLTQQATSIDGQHYRSEPNVLMAQILLNQIAAELAQRERQQRARERLQTNGAAAAAAPPLKGK